MPPRLEPLKPLLLHKLQFKKIRKISEKNIIIIKRNIIRSEKKKKRKWNKKLRRRRKNRKEQFFLSTTCNTSTWKNSLKRAWDLSSFSTFYDYYQSDGSTFQYVFISLANRKKCRILQTKHSRSFLSPPFFLSPLPPYPFSLSFMYDQSCPPEKKDLKKIIKKTRSVQDKYYFIKCSKFELIFECFSPKVYLTSNRKFIWWVNEWRNLQYSRGVFRNTCIVLWNIRLKYCEPSVIRKKNIQKKKYLLCSLLFKYTREPSMNGKNFSQCLWP